jgi:predicted anti-sigma-YlaC factor YlaD
MQLCAHARQCPTCAQWLATETALIEIVAGKPQAEPSPEFTMRVVQTVEIERHQQRRQHRWQLISLAVAASLLVAVMAWRGPAGREVPGELAATTQPPELPAAMLERMGQVSQDIKPVSGSVYTALNAIWLAQRLL